MTAVAEKKHKCRALPDPTSPYVRGDGAAGRYLGFIDSQGRTFRTWASDRKVPYALIGGVAVYRKADLDKAWASCLPAEFSVRKNQP